MFLEAEMLPHLICSRPMFIGGATDEADQHRGAGRIGGGDSRAVYAQGDRAERGRFAVVTGFHRKHAMRLLRAGQVKSMRCTAKEMSLT
jgi:hypothetical protein